MSVRRLDPRRECGDCTACCVLHGAPGEGPRPCRYVAQGRGCEIYTHRPESCRRWFCEWRYGFGAEEHRPDKVGVVPHPGTSPGTVRLAYTPYGVTSALRGLVEWMKRHGLTPVWVRLRTQNDVPGPVRQELAGPPAGEES